MRVQLLGQEDPLKEGMATPNSSILVWRIPRIKEPGGYSPQDHKKADRTKATQHTSTMCNLHN